MTEARRLDGRSKLLTSAGLCALAAIHFALAFDTLRQKTPTVDEVAHLPAGLSYLENGTFKMYRLSPPLARLLPAAAVAPMDLPLYYEGTWKRHEPVNHWLFAFSFLAANGSDREARARYLEAFTRARMVIAAWSALSIPFLFLWGSWWFGPRAGWLAAALWTISPNVIAHAGLATTDLPATSLGLVASFFFARWLDRPTWLRAATAGIWLGLAQLVKFSSLWLVVIWLVWGLCEPLWAQPENRWTAFLGRLRVWRALTTNAGRQALVIGAVCLLVLNAGYLFEGSFTPLGRFTFVSQWFTRPRLAGDGVERTSNRTANQVLAQRVNRFRGTLIGLVPCPLPYHYVAGFDEQKFEADGKYQMYLRGRFADQAPAVGSSSRRGWRYYYLYALAIKVPLSTWLLVGMGLLSAALWPRGAGASLWPLVLAAAIPLAAMSLLTDINLGVRYVLPIFPFLFLIAGSSAGASRPAWWNWLTVAAVAWNAVAVARIHPNELAYFNELVGPKNGRFHLIDSNIDWGQDLRTLARWLDHNPDWRGARIAYMGTVPPRFEGIADYRLAPRDLRFVPKERRFPWEDPDDPTTYGPQPGKYAVSANFERGMFFHSPLPAALLPEALLQSPGSLMPGWTMLWNPRDDRSRFSSLEEFASQASWFYQSPRNAYAYFQAFKPRIEPEIGYSILLYDISLEEANRVRAQMALPPTRAAGAE